jgi:hypothetical protein
MVIIKEPSKKKDGIYNRIMELLDQEIIIDFNEEDHKDILEGISKTAKFNISESTKHKKEVVSNLANLKKTAIFPFNGHNFDLYIHYKNKSKHNILSYGGDHRGLLSFGYFKVISLRDFIYKEIDDLEVKFVVEKEKLTLSNFFEYRDSLKLCVDDLNRSFNEKLRDYLKENIQNILLENQYGIRMIEIETYPPLDLILDPENKKVFSLKEVLYYTNFLDGQFNIVSLENNKAVLSTMIDRMEYNDVPAVLDFLMNNFFEKLEPYFERKVEDKLESDELVKMVTKFEGLLENLVEEFFYKNSTFSELGSKTVRSLFYVKNYDCPNLFSSNYKFKKSFIESVILQLESTDDVCCFIDTFKNLDIVQDVSENKNIRKITVRNDIFDDNLSTLERIIDISSTGYPIKDYIFPLIKVDYCYDGDPAIPLINKKSLPIFQKINSLFETNIPQSILDTCESIIN